MLHLCLLIHFTTPIHTWESSHLSGNITEEEKISGNSYWKSQTRAIIKKNAFMCVCLCGFLLYNNPQKEIKQSEESFGFMQNSALCTKKKPNCSRRTLEA